MTRLKHLLVLASVISIDQLSKYVFSSEALINQGVALGGLSGSPVVAFALHCIFLFVILYLYFQSRDSKSRLIFVTIFSAGLSNLLDRIVFGGVRDFIYIENLTTFNVADLIITLSVTILLLIYILDEYKDSHSQKRRGRKET